MKFAFALCVLSLVALTIADEDFVNPHPRGCIYIFGTCIEDCPVGTHAYTIGCSRKMPEATCDQPNPVLEEYVICDFSQCYCDPPTVRDTINNKCVQLADCPKKE